ncbi:ATP-binding protein [Pantoea phytobeneficialis]|uniref:ATP-binding protein n=1 Tax=Pantoea phytobeneficialis TaxID=2052056 RepID=A0AAP9KNI6_9GAMM|nr:ATP-binding protein [Pantoea phytobeneficialis]MDO6407227.1 ATP-binding protein [Pantoea phytobeneficialis]QGR05847.1 histidine kinase [Pantoea phytobeneficialis]
MIETLAFRTQARTVDHLGREQIADCPTAISELWKNAYDAYARDVSLHIFDDPEPVAAVFDDGHGMNYDEFINRWLVVGTDSKYDTNTSDDDDRDGLPKRTKQGQKGIGRLSSANLGPLLLIVSKRKKTDFVAALIDWRIFENPYLVLSDIEIPVTQFAERTDLFQLLPDLFERLKDNISGNISDEKRANRLKLAWETYDRVILEDDPEAKKPSELITNTIINARFEKRHFEPWLVWNEKRQHGTALIVSDINYDLKAQLPSIELDSNIKNIRDSFFSTLSAFTDPYVAADASEFNAFDPRFSYEVKTWSETFSSTIIENDREAINREVTEEMEHVLSGNIDEYGVFRGQVKAFGEWRKLGTDYVIYPPKDLTIPKGPTTFIGPFSLHIATFELMRDSSTLSNENFTRFLGLAKQHSGFLIFRNGLRVLPYGRETNDFFEIERQRSVNAGREYWNARRMFGRIAISRELNPNLRDKAGREGFIDNRATKVLREVVKNILKRAAYEYFGSNSDLRKELLPDIRAQNEKDRAEKERKELAKLNAQKFRSRLNTNLPILFSMVNETEKINANIHINNELDLDNTQTLISELSMRLADLRVVGAPAKLGSAEDDYRTFRTMYTEMLERIHVLEQKRADAIQSINPAKPEDIAQKQLSSHASKLQARLRSWRKSIDTLQGAERDRVSTLFDERNKAFHLEAMPLVDQVRIGLLGLDQALEQMKAIYTKLDMENEDTFQSYLDALELMSENINIELIARQGTADNITLRDDLNRLNQVAQLGITVEILGHELTNNERMVREGIRKIRTIGDIPGTNLVVEGFEALSQQLEFLSPLKVSGNKTRRQIFGKDIEDYIISFFESVLHNRAIKIHASKEFRAFSIFDQPSRIYPVFVNLVNNSVYWLVTSSTPNAEVYLSILDDKVIISDNGPGINPVDQENLFKMFFTRKSSGGRGIGLYLCRVNLMASGHSIEYATDRKFRLLAGANFVINFKGANFG